MLSYVACAPDVVALAASDPVRDPYGVSLLCSLPLRLIFVPCKVNEPGHVPDDIVVG